MLQICYLQLAAKLLFSLTSVNSRHMFPPGPDTPILSSFQISFPRSELGAYERIDLQASKEKGRPKLSAMEGDLVLTSLVVSLKNAPGFSQESANDNGSDVAHNAGKCVYSELYHLPWIEYEYLVLPTIPTTKHSISYTSTKARKRGSIELMVKLQMLMPTSHHVKSDGIFG